MTLKKEHLSLNFIDIINYAIKWKKHLMILILIAAVLSALISSPIFIKPKYKAEVVFYPTTINSIGNALFTDLNKREADVLAFGEEQEAENALQLLQSSSMSGRISKNFDLLKHYNIDPKGNKPKTKLANKMAKNISFQRTRYLSIKISVLDENPEKAAKMANGIAEIYDTVKTEIQKQLANETFKIVEDEYNGKVNEVNEIKGKLKTMGENGITNYEEQARAIAEEIAKLQSRGLNNAALQNLKVQQAELAKYAGDFQYYNESLKLELDALDKLKARYKKAKVDIEKTITHKFLVTSADTPEEKAYPIRSIIVLMSTIFAFFVGLIVIILIEKLGKSNETIQSV